jgi:four helix bundle protein
MKSNNIVLIKSYSFSLRIIKLYKFLKESKTEYILSNQILRSGTSIGANIEEAVGGHSRKDFYSKLNIAYKETRETHYWIRLLRDSEILSKLEAQSILEDCEELQKILASILRSQRKE